MRMPSTRTAGFQLLREAAFCYTLLVIVVVLAGCASPTGANSAATTQITSKCDDFCQDLVAGTFQIVPFSALIGRDKPVDSIIVSKLNGVQGSNRYFDPEGSYNSTWDGGYLLPAVPGTNRLFVYPSAVINAPNEGADLEFEAVEGHKYFVGRMGWKKIKVPIEIHYWHFVVVDLTAKKIVYPLDKPHWKTFCVIMREFAGGTPCPPEDIK